MNVVMEAGPLALLCIVLTLVGLAVTVVFGRRSGKAGATSASFAAAAASVGLIGAALGQRAVAAAVERAASDQAVATLSLGTREASANLLVAGVCALLLVITGAAIGMTSKAG